MNQRKISYDSRYQIALEVAQEYCNTKDKGLKYALDLMSETIRNKLLHYLDNTDNAGSDLINDCAVILMEDENIVTATLNRYGDEKKEVSLIKTKKPYNTNLKNENPELPMSLTIPFYELVPNHSINSHTAIRVLTKVIEDKYKNQKILKWDLAPSGEVSILLEN